MAQQSAGKKQSGKKLRRCSKHANYYKIQAGRTETNKRRTLGRRIRNHPHDIQAIKLYNERYANTATGHLNNPSSKGRKLRRR